MMPGEKEREYDYEPGSSDCPADRGKEEQDQGKQHPAGEFQRVNITRFFCYISRRRPGKYGVVNMCHAAILLLTGLNKHRAHFIADPAAGNFNFVSHVGVSSPGLFVPENLLAGSYVLAAADSIAELNPYFVHSVKQRLVGVVRIHILKVPQAARPPDSPLLPA
jgi:hypothetical protein